MIYVHLMVDSDHVLHCGELVSQRGSSRVVGVPAICIPFFSGEDLAVTLVTSNAEVFFCMDKKRRIESS
jgi:hypothetical protein